MRWEEYGILRAKRVLNHFTMNLDRRFSEDDIATIFWFAQQLNSGQSSIEEIRLIKQFGGDA